MKRLVLFDSGPTGYICTATAHRDRNKLFNFLKSQQVYLYLPEIVDYELRRELKLQNLTKSINVLNQFRQRNLLLYLRSEDLMQASDLWAWCRLQGRPMTNPQRLDVDVILVSQAIAQKEVFDEVIILTSDVGDLSTFCEWGISIWPWKYALSDCSHGSITLYKPPVI